MQKLITFFKKLIPSGLQSLEGELYKAVILFIAIFLF